MRSEITTELLRFDEVAVPVDNEAITDEVLFAVEVELRHHFDGVTGVLLTIDRDGGWATLKFTTGLTQSQRARCENILDHRLPDGTETVVRWSAVKIVTQLTNEVLFYKAKRPIPNEDSEPDTLNVRAPNLRAN